MLKVTEQGGGTLGWNLTTSLGDPFTPSAVHDQGVPTCSLPGSPRLLGGRGRKKRLIFRRREPLPTPLPLSPLNTELAPTDPTLASPGHPTALSSTLEALHAPHFHSHLRLRFPTPCSPAPTSVHSKVPPAPQTSPIPDRACRLCTPCLPPISAPDAPHATFHLFLKLYFGTSLGSSVRIASQSPCLTGA